MRESIHPPYMEAVVTCACGNTFTTRSTVSKIRLEICSNCHPFYTGKQKILDTAGRLERFEKRYARTGGKTVVRKPTVTAAAPKTSKSTRKILRNTPRAVPPARPAKPAKTASR